LDPNPKAKSDFNSNSNPDLIHAQRAGSEQRVRQLLGINSENHESPNLNSNPNPSLTSSSCSSSNPALNPNNPNPNPNPNPNLSPNHPIPFGPYGLGTARTLESFQRSAGLCFDTLTVTNPKPDLPFGLSYSENDFLDMLSALSLPNPNPDSKSNPNPNPRSKPDSSSKPNPCYSTKPNFCYYSDPNANPSSALSVLNLVQAYLKK
jgi:hypothetical protein